MRVDTGALRYNPLAAPDPRVEPAPPPLAAPVVCRLIRSGRVWVCDDELAVSRVPLYALAHDRRGYLWLGSEDGPLLFDGLAWTAPQASGGPRGAIVRAFAATEDTLWLGTDGAGVAAVAVDTSPYRSRGHITRADGLPSNGVRALCAAGGGRVWAATDAGLALLDAETVTRVLTTADGLPSGDVRALCLDAAGRLWAGTDAGLAVIEDAVVVACLPCGDTRHLCQDRAGRLWAGLFSGEIVRLTYEPGSPPVMIPGHACGERLRALCADADGYLWVGTDAGVLQLRDGIVHDAFTLADGLPAQGVWALCADRQGRMWAGTSSGLVILRASPLPVRALPVDASTTSSPAFSFAPDGAGRMWVGTESGLALLDARTEQPVLAPPLPPTLATGAVSFLHHDAEGQLWAGTRRHGLVCLASQTGRVLAEGIVGPDVPALCAVGERRLWASVSGQGLACIDTQHHTVVQRLGTAEGLPDDYILTLCAGPDGRLWAGTWSGWLTCIDPHRGVVVATFCLNPARQEHPITQIACTPGGRLWVGTHGGGLVCVDPRDLSVVCRVTRQDGLPSDVIYGCQLGDRGQLWVGTRRGIVRYTPATGECALFSRGLGLPHDECNQQSLYLDERRRLWVGTLQGVGLIETAQIPPAVPPCDLNLTGFKVMGRERAVAPGLVLEDDEYDLLFEYGALTFTAAAQVVYRVQLVGLEATWSAPTQQRSARYTNLRPGAYTFRVAARNWGGQWSEPIEVPFTVVRNRKTQESEEAFERERIAKEVYRATAERLEELNSRLEEANRLKTELALRAQVQAQAFEQLARKDGLTGLLTRRALDEILAEEFGRSRRYGRPLTVALLDIDHFKAVNDTFSHHVGDQVLQIVARLCQQTCRASDSVGRYGGEEIALVLPETAMVEGVEICERLRQTIVDYPWDTIATGLRVTISSGVSDWLQAPDHEKMLGDADTYLYQAKRGGRNRSCWPLASRPAC